MNELAPSILIKGFIIAFACAILIIFLIGFLLQLLFNLVMCTRYTDTEKVKRCMEANKEMVDHMLTPRVLIATSITTFMVVLVLYVCL